MNNYLKIRQHNYEVINMTKDSQPDNKQARAEKSNYQTPNTRENQNNNKNAKRQSTQNCD